jgi:hypothetical protein
LGDGRIAYKMGREIELFKTRGTREIALVN